MLCSQYSAVLSLGLGGTLSCSGRGLPHPDLTMGSRLPPAWNWENPHLGLRYPLSGIGVPPGRGDLGKNVRLGWQFNPLLFMDTV